MLKPKFVDVTKMTTVPVSTFHDLYTQTILPCHALSYKFVVARDGGDHVSVDFNDIAFTVDRVADTLLTACNSQPFRLFVYNAEGLPEHCVHIPDVEWVRAAHAGKTFASVIRERIADGKGASNWLLHERNLLCVAQWLSLRTDTPYVTPPEVYSVRSLRDSPRSPRAQATVEWLSSNLLNKMLCLVIRAGTLVDYEEVEPYFTEYPQQDVRAMYEHCCAALGGVSPQLMRLPNTVWTIGLRISNSKPCTRLMALQLLNQLYTARQFKFINIFCIQADALHMLVQGLDVEVAQERRAYLIANGSSYVSATDVLDSKELDQLLRTLYLCAEAIKSERQYRQSVLNAIPHNICETSMKSVADLITSIFEYRNSLHNLLDRELHARVLTLTAWCTSAELFWILIMLAHDKSELLDPRLFPSLMAAGDEQQLVKILIQDLERLSNSGHEDHTETLLMLVDGESRHKEKDLQTIKAAGYSPSLITMLKEINDAPDI